MRLAGGPDPRALRRRGPGSAGFLTPDQEIRFDEDGEFLVRGPLLLSGYLEPEDAVGAFTDDGFHRTGDRARIDDGGCLRIEGRDAAEALLRAVGGALHAFGDCEKPKKLLILPGPPADHPSILTPTLKLKRATLLGLLCPRLAALHEPRQEPAS